MRPVSIREAIRDVVIGDYGLVDYEDMVDAIDERVRLQFIIPVLRENNLPVPPEVV